MSNDDPLLLGLDSMKLVEDEQPAESKWRHVPKKRQGGYATKTRPGVFGDETEVQPGVWVSPAPDLGRPLSMGMLDKEEAPGSYSPVHKQTTDPGECCYYIRDPRVAPAYAVTKPSWLQRMLDRLVGFFWS